MTLRRDLPGIGKRPHYGERCLESVSRQAPVYSDSPPSNATDAASRSRLGSFALRERAKCLRCVGTTVALGGHRRLPGEGLVEGKVQTLVGQLLRFRDGPWAVPGDRGRPFLGCVEDR